MSKIAPHLTLRLTAAVFGCVLLSSAAVSRAADFTRIEKLPDCCTESPFGPGDYRRDFEVGGQTRTYLIHVPKSYKHDEPMPVVLNFHGGGGNATSQIELTGMNETADSAGFIAVYPSGSGRLKMFLTFNAGTCCGYARDKDIDDVRYAEGLLDDLNSIFCVDPARIYATGHSNGAMMSYLLACKMSDRIAAVAAVAGPMGIESCKPSRPVPILHFHGTADQCAPYIGGTGKSKDAGVFRSVDGTVAQWEKIDGCTGEARVTFESGQVTCTTFEECRNGAEVTLCTIAGGGHAWPGGNKYPAQKICGGTLSHEISANDFMWKFFAKHPMPGAEPSPTREGGRRQKPDTRQPEKP